MTIYSPPQTIAQASRYLSQGFAPIPVRYRDKSPTLSKWQQITLTQSDIQKHFGTEHNIGVVLGTRSSGLIDVDVDDNIALKLAPAFLPDTGMVFGRTSRRRSHWIYRCSVTKTKQYVGENGMIVEMRGDRAQTVFPGSIHSSGEPVAFDLDGEPANVGYDELEFACEQLCIAATLARHWNAGSRHALALATSGFLAKSRWDEADTLAIIMTVASAVGDTEHEDRQLCVAQTYQKLASGEPVQGYAKLSEILGKKVADKLAQWCGPTADLDIPWSLPPTAEAIVDISTDTRAAEAFAGSYNDEIVYCEEMDGWFRKDNQVHRPISAVQIQGVATTFARTLAVQIAGHLPGGMWQARSMESCGRINSLVQLARAKLLTAWGKIDKARGLIGLVDGSVYDLDAGRLTTQPQSLVTKSIGTQFDEGASCSNWLKFLDRIFAGDQETIAFVQRAVGYSLSGEVGEQSMFLLVGTGANGKSTFITALNHLFGDYAATIPMHTLMLQRNGNEQTNDLALLPNKRFVVASEGEPGQRLAESRIKLMTGGDKISCRRLYGDYFTFEPQFKLWLATNSLPLITGVDEAIWRRMHVIRFPVTIPVAERDLNLGYALQAELPGILNWALQGYQDWKQHKLSPPPQVTSATGEYRRDNDTVGQFIEACCERDPRAVTSAKDLYDCYSRWADESGLGPLHKTMFGKTLAQKDFAKVARSSGSAWKGLNLKPTDVTELLQRKGLTQSAE